MSKETKLIILGAVFFVVIGCYICFQKDVPLSEKEQKIETTFQSAMPVGSKVKDVASYLDANKIVHDGLDKKSHDMTAIIRNVERDGFAITDVQVVFRFDEHEKLLSFTLKEAMRGVRN